jgi:hypothetical protein
VALQVYARSEHSGNITRNRHCSCINTFTGFFLIAPHYFLGAHSAPYNFVPARNLYVVSNTNLEIGKTSESSERLGLAWFIKLAPRQQHGVLRCFLDYNKALSTIYTHTKPKYLVRAERGARGKKTTPHVAGVRIYHASKQCPISRLVLFTTWGSVIIFFLHK